jgi:predicted ArsR family transcriptional regulator
LPRTTSFYTVILVENPTGLGPLPTERDGGAAQRLTAQRRRALRALEDLAHESPDQPVSIAAVAAELDLHVNTAREHLDRLVSSGLARRSRLAPAGRGRPGWGYTPSPRRSPAAAEYVTLARVLADHVAEQGGDVRSDMITLGRRWGHSLADTDPGAEESADETVIRFLGDLGFDPDVSAQTPSVRVRLRRCPILEVAKQRPEVVCQVHRGIVEGVLEAKHAPRDVSLQAFAEPGACLLHLTPVAEPDAEARTDAPTEAPDQAPTEDAAPASG